MIKIGKDAKNRQQYAYAEVNMADFITFLASKRKKTTAPAVRTSSAANKTSRYSDKSLPNSPTLGKRNLYIKEL